MAKKDKKDEKKPSVHKDLEGFDIKINSFGEIIRSHDIDDLNKFLDDNVEDKKLDERDGEFGEDKDKKD